MNPSDPESPRLGNFICVTREPEQVMPFQFWPQGSPPDAVHCESCPGEFMELNMMFNAEVSDESVAPWMKLGSNPTMQSISRAKTTRFSVIFFLLNLVSLSLSLSKTR
jgi:hypothetical protein